MDDTDNFCGIPATELAEELARRTGMSYSRAEEITEILVEMLKENPASLLAGLTFTYQSEDGEISCTWNWNACFPPF